MGGIWGLMVEKADFTYRATAAHPTWVHRKAGKRAEPRKGGKDALLVGPEILRDGDKVTLCGSDISWVKSNLPENFIPVSKPAPRSPKTPEADTE